MKTFIALTTLLFTAMISQAAAQTVAIDPANSNTVTATDNGMNYYDAHQYKEAITEFTKAIKENEKDGKAYYYRGLSKMHLKQAGYCKDMEEALKLGYVTSADIYYYGCDTHTK